MQETDFIKPSSPSSSLNSPGTLSEQRPFILGVAGGSGSGKTFFSEALVAELTRHHGEGTCQIVYQDNFYIDQSHRFDKDGGAVNFDHPDSIDFTLLAQCLRCLKNGEPVQIPMYDFATHKRRAETLQVTPKKIIVVDGILIFHAAQVRELFDDLVFFQTPEELRFSRRLERDVKERGRTAEGVKEQFIKQVKPMHDLFVEPSKVYANTVVHDLGEYDQVLKEYCERLMSSGR